MNILTFDIEEWALARSGGYGTSMKYAQYDAILDKILELLDTASTKATFFCTGQMAEFFPDVVRRILSRGHEIGCHSYSHTWMNKMDYKTAESDTKMAVDALEQCTGEKVLCYRAPAFSIGESNKWLFEILVSCGITCDASIFPAERDFGGFPGFNCQEPCVLENNGIRLKEFPIRLTPLFGRGVAFTGGGYFRLFPYDFVKSHVMRSNYAMCYFHINDLMWERIALKSREEYELYYKEPGTIKNRYMRYIKSNVGRTNAWKKFNKLLKDVRFANIHQFICETDENQLPIVYL